MLGLLLLKLLVQGELLHLALPLMDHMLLTPLLLALTNKFSLYLQAGSARELMLVFELKLIEELLILALEQLADVKHFKQLRLVFTLMAFH
jgi:hypothetical protein